MKKRVYRERYIKVEEPKKEIKEEPKKISKEDKKKKSDK